MLLLHKFNEIWLRLKKTITTIENLSEILPYFQNWTRAVQFKKKKKTTQAYDFRPNCTPLSLITD